MALFIDNAAQAGALSAAEAVGVMEAGIRALAGGDALRRPRIDCLLPTPRAGEFFCFSTMEGGQRTPGGYYALRIKPDIVAWPVVGGMRRRVTYCSRPGLYGGLVLLFSTDTAELLAILNDGFVQHARVAATAALGVKYMSRADADVLAILGSGGMAHAFAEAFCEVRPVRAIRVYSPNRENRNRFAAEMGKRLSCTVEAADGAEEAVRGASLVAACTNSLVPVLRGEWLQPGCHLANVNGHEVPADARARVDAVGLFVRRIPPSADGLVDDGFAMRTDVLSWAAGRPEELAGIPARPASPEESVGALYPRARVVDCVDWRSGAPYRRERPEEITTVANMSHGTLPGRMGASAGIQGLQFAAVAGRIYENACARGLGTELPAEMFLQDIPT